jgi:alkylation response protein AidB-like acyl-CoA dehydrogenase
MIDLLSNSEQQQIVDSLQAMLRNVAPVETCKPSEVFPAAANTAAAQSLASLGILGIGMPEERGGVGYGVCEETLAFRELGRFLISPNLLASSTVARLLPADGEGSGDLLEARRSACFGIRRFDGTDYLIDGTDASWVIFIEDDRLAVFACDDIDAREAVEGLDWTVPLSAGRLKPGAVPVATGNADELRRAILLLAAMAVGVTEATRDMAVAYAKVRHQFGQPIGAFQAIKHKCADMAVASETSGTQTLLAALACASGSGNEDYLVRSAIVLAIDAAQRNARENIQIHGGIGYTAESRAHLYLKRAHLMEAISGGIHRHREAIIADRD